MATIGSLAGARSVVTVQGTANIIDAARTMAEHNVGALAVMEGARLVGIFSERDVITRVIAKKLDPGAIAVRDVMTKQLVVGHPDETDESCLRKMKAANCRHLPIVSGETLMGMISLRDLLQVELSDKDEKLEYLTSYLFHLPPGAEQQTK